MLTPESKYLGRQGMVRNLRDHLIKGTSAVVTGGPGMGKTTLLKQTAQALAHGTTLVSIDLLRDKPGDPARRIPDGLDSVILLLDGCEILLPDPVPFLNQIIQAPPQSDKKIRSIVWAGRVPWGEWAMAHRSEFSCPIRFYPLLVLPPREARAFLKDHLPKEVSSSELERYLEMSGGHPYLLSRMVEQGDVECDSFLGELWKAADSPIEYAAMTQLIEAGSWVLLDDLKNEAGGKLPKKVLDRLATLGLIIRTLVDGSAMAKAVSPLLGDSVRRAQRIATEKPELEIK